MCIRKLFLLKMLLKPKFDRFYDKFIVHFWFSFQPFATILKTIENILYEFEVKFGNKFMSLEAPLYLF